jgi:hypothetical protein
VSAPGFLVRVPLAADGSGKLVTTGQDPANSIRAGDLRVSCG